MGGLNFGAAQLRLGASVMSQTIQIPGHDIEFEIEPEKWVKGSVILLFPRCNRYLVYTIMCVILKHTDNDDSIYYVRTVGQCRGWR